MLSSLYYNLRVPTLKTSTEIISTKTEIRCLSVTSVYLIDCGNLNMRSDLQLNILKTQIAIFGGMWLNNSLK